MTYDEAQQHWQDFDRLYMDYKARNWHPRELPPPEVQRWLACTGMLLDFCHRLIMDDIERPPAA